MSNHSKESRLFFISSNKCCDEYIIVSYRDLRQCFPNSQQHTPNCASEPSSSKETTSQYPRQQPYRTPTTRTLVPLRQTAKPHGLHLKYQISMITTVVYQFTDTSEASEHPHLCEMSRCTTQVRNTIPRRTKQENIDFRHSGICRHPSKTKVKSAQPHRRPDPEMYVIEKASHPKKQHQ